jgi:hypothetical protein
MGLFHWLFGGSSQTAAADRPFTIRTVDRANELGNAILMEGNIEEAIPVFEQGVALSPNHVGVLFNLAVAYRLAGRFSDGKRICKKLLSINRMDGDAQGELEGCNEKDPKGSAEYETARKAFLSGSSKPSVERLTLELIAIGEGDGFLNHNDPRPPQFNDRGRHKRAYKIGETLNEMGGFSLMQSVGMKINSMPIPRGLEHCWGGNWLMACLNNVAEPAVAAAGAASTRLRRHSLPGRGTAPARRPRWLPRERKRGQRDLLSVAT